MSAKSATVTILGCGTSGGVPQLLSGWGACDPDQPKNNRRRCSILIEQPEASLLVDTTPECRVQLLPHDIRKITHLLFTHVHADHCHGIDECRWICQSRNQAIETYGFPEHLNELKRKFYYAFTPLKEGAKGYSKPVLIPHEVQDNQPFEIIGMPIFPMKLDHGFSEVLGFRLGDFAYTTDVVNLSDDQLDHLKGVKTWVVDCLRYVPHPTHAHLERTLNWINSVKPERAYLTHMNNDMDYDRLCSVLPEDVLPAYDGLRFTIDW